MKWQKCIYINSYSKQWWADPLGVFLELCVKSVTRGSSYWDLIVLLN